MAEKSELADYADMQRTMERTNQIDVLDGRRCPHPDCSGMTIRDEEGVACAECGQWLIRLY